MVADIPILDEMYNNNSEKGGRPNFDIILMFKALIFEEWYGLSDMEVERQIADHVTFMGFLGFPKSIDPRLQHDIAFQGTLEGDGKIRSGLGGVSKAVGCQGLKG